MTAMNKSQMCGTCRWHKPDKSSPKKRNGRHLDWECSNEGSYYFVEITHAGGTCEYWEGRE